MSPRMSPRFHSLDLIEVRRETPDAVSLSFQVPADLAEAYRFDAGQYLTLRTVIAGEEVRRAYSICSGTDGGELRVAVKRVPGGVFSTFANAGLKAGDRLDVMTPMGSFTTAVQPDAARLHLAIACGSGITPILSLARTLLAQEPQSRFVLLYGNRTTGDILFRDDLAAMKDQHMDRLSVFHVLSREAQDVPILHGRLDEARLGTLLGGIVPAREADTVFLCGPEGMIEAATAVLANLGVDPARVHAERFTPAEGSRRGPAPTAEALAQPFATAEIVLDGRHHTVPVAEGEMVIDAALRAGLDLPYSCKGGMCCTCRARIVEGTVEMELNYSLQPWEIAAGFVLTCQSRPTSDHITIDYDAA